MKRGLLVVVALCAFVFNVNHAEAATLYRLPLDASNYQGILNWFDHNPNAGAFRRYDGNTADYYDTHRGTDFRAIMSNVPIRSGAYGSLYYRYDGCPVGSLQSTCGNGGFGNHVRIEHADGKVTMYAHMALGTPVGIQSILCGAYVGTMGTSGRSSAVHLHFELWGGQNYGPSIDFFGGPYSNGGFSYWVNQNGGNPTTQCQ